MIHIFVGLPGSGKTMKLASVAVKLLKRNRSVFKRKGIRRMVYSNLKFSPSIEKEFGDFIYYWHGLEEIVNSHDVDVIWQEMSGYLDSQEWEKVGMDFKWWLRLHRHKRVDIYGDTQDFPTIDVSVRRITDHVYMLRKLFGSKEKMFSLKKPYVWGLVILLHVKRECYKEEKEQYRFNGIRLMWLRNKVSKYYDSYADIETDIFPPLKHITRYCVKCGKVHTIHK